MRPGGRKDKERVIKRERGREREKFGDDRDTERCLLELKQRATKTRRKGSLY